MHSIVRGLKLTLIYSMIFAYSLQASAGGLLLEKKGLKETNRILGEIAVEQFMLRLVRGVELGEAINELKDIDPEQAKQLREYLKKKDLSEKTVFKAKSAAITSSGVKFVAPNGRTVYLSRSTEPGVVLLNGKKIQTEATSEKKLTEQIERALRDTHVAGGKTLLDLMLPQANASLFFLGAGLTAIVSVIAVLGLLGWAAYNDIKSSMEGSLEKRIARLADRCTEEKEGGKPYQGSTTELALTRFKEIGASTPLPRGGACRSMVVEYSKNQKTAPPILSPAEIESLCAQAERFAKCAVEYTNAASSIESRQAVPRQAVPRN